MKYTVLEALLVTGQIEHKLVLTETFEDEGGDPSTFFVVGLSRDHRKVGEVELTITQDLSGRLDYAGALPDIWVESHE